MHLFRSISVHPLLSTHAVTTFTLKVVRMRTLSSGLDTSTGKHGKWLCESEHSQVVWTRQQANMENGCENQNTLKWFGHVNRQTWKVVVRIRTLSSGLDTSTDKHGKWL